MKPSKGSVICSVPQIPIGVERFLDTELIVVRYMPPFVHFGYLPAIADRDDKFIIVKFMTIKSKELEQKLS